MRIWQKQSFPNFWKQHLSFFNPKEKEKRKKAESWKLTHTAKRADPALTLLLLQPQFLCTLSRKHVHLVPRTSELAHLWCLAQLCSPVTATWHSIVPLLYEVYHHTLPSSQSSGIRRVGTTTSVLEMRTLNLRETKMISKSQRIRATI